MCLRNETKQRLFENLRMSFVLIVRSCLDSIHVSSFHSMPDCDLRHINQLKSLLPLELSELTIKAH